MSILNPLHRTRSEQSKETEGTSSCEFSLAVNGFNRSDSRARVLVQNHAEHASETAWSVSDKPCKQVTSCRMARASPRNATLALMG